MNKLNREKQIEIVKCLVEGNSIRSASRITGTSRNTVSKLILALGEACEKFHDENVKNVNSKRVECDEIWSYVGKKDANCTPAERGSGELGSVWTWTALDADSKLIVSWLIGGRDGEYAYAFMSDVASRLANRVQLTTDAHSVYLTAVRESFGDSGVDYAMLVKKYGKGEGSRPETRYSPAICTGIEKQPKLGNPDSDLISTSYVERQNLSMRMNMRRYTRLTNGFSKSIEHHIAAVAIYFMHYNFVRIHQTLRVTPAMEAGLTKHLWEIGDLVDLMR
ncbi:MAG: IS1 family transposase [Candidatus Kapaibacterium sp.]